MRAPGLVVSLGLSALLVGCGLGLIDGVDQRSDDARKAAKKQYLPGEIPSTGPVPEGCFRIEGSDIGSPGLSLQLGEGSLQIVSWTQKTGESEFVGFQLTASGPVAYAVKAGGETYIGTAASWVHPEGVSGPEASGISNVTFCPGLPGAPQGDPGVDAGGGADTGVNEGGGTGGESGADGGTVDEGGGSGGVTPLPPASAGGRCTANNGCISGSCVNLFCEQSAAGDPCYTNADCRLGSTCSQGVCVGSLN